MKNILITTGISVKKYFNKNYQIILNLPFCFLFICILSSCTQKEPYQKCVTGIIVGQKCNAYALQLDEDSHLKGKIWSKKTFGEDGIRIETDYENVVGLMHLPEPYQREGIRLYVRLEAQESFVPCYLDMPNPPDPAYVVLAVDSLACPSEPQLL